MVDIIIIFLDIIRQINSWIIINVRPYLYIYIIHNICIINNKKCHIQFGI